MSSITGGAITKLTGGTFPDTIAKKSGTGPGGGKAGTTVGAIPGVCPAKVTGDG